MISLKQFLQNNRWAIFLSLLFICIYSLLVFANHYCFRTFALDLGVYTNAIYDYSHLQWNDTTVFKYNPENLLSDHFDLTLILFSPLGYLFGEYTLLILQIASIIIGAFGVYKYLQFKFADQRLSNMGMLHFYLFFGIFSALSFDYHANVVAAMLSPWLFYFIAKKQYLRYGLLMLFMMMAKEPVSLWCFCISLGLLLENRKDKVSAIYLGLFSVMAISYFLLMVKIVMPAMASTGEYDHFRYAILGKDLGDAIKNIFLHPFTTLQHLFTNHTDKTGLNWVKTEFYCLAIFSGVYCLFFRPAFLVMLIAPLFVKMFNDDPTKWSIDCHYSIEFASIITIGAFTFIGEISNEQRKKILPVILCLGSAFATYKITDKNIYYHDYNRLKIYHSHHYNRSYDLKKVHASFKLIPDDAIVCAQSPIVPHLAFRDNCYTIPMVKDAEYIIGSKSEPTCYPISEEDFRKLLRDSLASRRWEAVVNDTNITILKRIR